MIYPVRFHHAASFFLHRSRAIFAAIDGGTIGFKLYAVMLVRYASALLMSCQQQKNRGALCSPVPHVPGNLLLLLVGIKNRLDNG